MSRKDKSMNETLEWIFKRRSIRAYTDEPISDEQVEALLQAAMAAPSANDQRPWAFVVVRDAAKKEALGKLHSWSTMCANAAVVFVVLGDTEESNHWVEDCSAATENLLLAATSMGIGTVWVAVYPHSEIESKARQLLKIPERFRVLCLVPAGKPARAKPARTRYEAGKVHIDTFGKPFKDG
jgi:nitroreductase